MKFENKVLSRLIPVCFFLILFGLMTATVFRHADEYSFYENRNMKKKPEVSGETVLSGAFFSEFEQYLEDHAAGRSTLIKLNTAVDLALRKPVVNDIVVRDDCLLPFNDYESSPDVAAIDKKAAKVTAALSRHRDKVEEYGGRFCYVAVPCQYVCRADDYPWYLNNRSEYVEASSSAFFKKLDEAGIDYVDMLLEYENYTDGEKARFSSSVDNHFSMFGAYRTYLKMTEKVNEYAAIPVPVLEEDDFEEEKIGNHYLGSRDRYLFDLWDSDESLYTIKLKNDVPFKRYNNGREGSPSLYKIPLNPYENVTYSVYMGGDNARTTIDTERPELPTVLVYGDSFTNAVECIIWYSFDKMESVDFRHYSEKTLDELIDEIRPDYVFCVRDYRELIESNANGK